MRKFFIVIVLLLIFGSFFYFRSDIKNRLIDFNQPAIPQAQDFQTVAENNKATDNNIEQNETTNNQPESFNLKVPFIVQAPFANWDEDYKEACEEASILMVDAFYNNLQLTEDQSAERLMEMINWQKANWGGHFDLNVNQTAKLAMALFGYQDYLIINNPTVEQIKSYLEKGWPVITPAAGQKLNNPHFRSPGPIYHMLVVKGFTADGFITNDPGTKFGDDYFYPTDTLMAALADWQETDFNQAIPKILIIQP